MGHSHWKASGLPLTQERLKEFLTYDPETGLFQWRVMRSGRKPNPSLGAGERPRKSGGRTISVDGVAYSNSRLAWLYMTGEWPIGTVGHRNGNMADDRIDNLEDTGCSAAEFTGKLITAARLRELVIYEPETGFFRWKQRSPRSGGGRAHAGEIVHTFLKTGYPAMNIDRRVYRQHRLAWLYVQGDWPSPGLMVDHTNGIKTDNRWCNLRLASRAQNARNRPHRKDSKMPFKGIFQCTDGKWGAQILLNLGRYDTPEEAHAAYFAAAQWYFGEFARAG
jgi:HNH endonuclease